MTFQKPQRIQKPWVKIMLYLVAGTFWGIAWISPTYASLAWVGMGALALALIWTQKTWSAFLGTWTVGIIARLIGLPWLADMNRIALLMSDAMSHGVMLLECIFCALPMAAMTAIGHTIARIGTARNLKIPALVWFPLCWALGEHLTFLMFGISNEAWLTTQWTQSTVLNVLGLIGWWPTLCLSLMVVAAIAQTIADTNKKWLLALTLPMLTLVLPPLKDVHKDQLKGIASVHIEDTLTTPHRAPSPDIDLVIWPEEARRFKPLLAEGQTPGAKLPPLLPDSNATHLLGLITQNRLLGRQNQIIEVAPDGSVGMSRAKKQLLLMGERKFMGIGRNVLQPGRLPTFIKVGKRRLVAIICGELLSRALVAEGVAHGGQVMVVSARDHIMATPRARRHMLAVQVMRSVEFGIPSVRSSLGGEAFFVSSTGQVLAQSDKGRAGFLMWDEKRGKRHIDFEGNTLTDPTNPPITTHTTAVLYDGKAPQFRTACPEGRCIYYDLNTFTCPKLSMANVIVAGHGKPPRWLSHSPTEIAQAVSCFEPDVIVIDTCLGASDELLRALTSMDAIVVASTTLVPPHGLSYTADFFKQEIEAGRRAQAVGLERASLLRWKTNAKSIDDALKSIKALNKEQLSALIVRRSPPLIKVALGQTGHMLVAVDSSYLGAPRRSQRRRKFRRRSKRKSHTKLKSD